MSATLPVRVMVEDVWDEISLELPAETPVADVKRQALALTRVKRDPSNYMVKYRGAELSETRSLAEAGMVPNGALIVLSRRRRPVR
jgi:hypothetical protein